MKFLVFVVIFVLAPTSFTYYHRYSEDVQTIRQSTANDVAIEVTQQSLFSLFPIEFKCVYLNAKRGEHLTQKFVLIDGLINKPRINAYVAKNNEYAKLETSDDLKTEYYRSVDGSSVATLIENKDLTIENVKTNLRFRAILTLYDNETSEEYHVMPFIIDYKSVLKNGASSKIESTLEHRVYARNKIRMDFSADFAELPYESAKTDFFRKNVKNTQSPTSLFVESVVVADYSAFLKHQEFIGTTETNLTALFTRIYYSHMINGVNQRYVHAFNSDPDLRIEVRLTNFVIQTQLEDSSWTSFENTGVPDYPTYNGKEVVESTRTLISFRNFMLSQKLPFSYDHAFGIFDKDLWGDDDGKASANQRSSVSGSAWIGGVCNTFRFSISEDSGFNTIPTLTHELGHNLGAYHDGFQGNVLASLCSPTDNYIMTPSNGNSRDKLQNSFKFSECSVLQFKSTLFAMDGTLKPQFSCLSNLPTDVPMEAFYFDLEFTGQIFDINSQCMLIIGSNSTHRGCETPSICETLYCRSTTSNSCRSIIGWGAAEGTSCGQNSICKSGQCVPVVQNVPQVSECSTNPCLNDGSCLQVSQFYLCDCKQGFTGLNCESEHTDLSTSSFE